MADKEFKPEQREVILVSHKPEWLDLARQEGERIKNTLSVDVIAVHHIGSTAIPGIKAKPILDFLLVVKDLDALDQKNHEMESLGYTAKGERGIPGRRFFSKDTNGKRSHHVHAFQPNNSEIKRHLIFRDYLLTHPKDARDYESLKEELAARFPHRSGDYTEGKTGFIQETVVKARRWKRQQEGS
ncbi:MAG: GrpB family protein [Anaerolineales bacterium]